MKQNVSQINDGITINVDECKKHHICENAYVCNPSTCICENGKYLAIR